ncbi:MAG: hypothetical protein HQK55_10825, partial [Deltaproteobacteria bacterium]|nr:hypothetical protein [Deltaproteobacteria bacterium]
KQHVVPEGVIAKSDLLKTFARVYRREDIVIDPGPAAMAIDRTLKTSNLILNGALWAAAGYQKPPTIPEMISEMANFNYRLRDL